MYPLLINSPRNLTSGEILYALFDLKLVVPYLFVYSLKVKFSFYLLVIFGFISFYENKKKI